MDTRQDILDEAARIVTGERQMQYGKPEDNFARIADLWCAYLGGVPITEWDVANMMALLKIARTKGGEVKRDNWVDIAGYAACGGEVQLKDSQKI